MLNLSLSSIPISFKDTNKIISGITFELQELTYLKGKVKEIYVSICNNYSLEVYKEISKVNWSPLLESINQKYIFKIKEEIKEENIIEKINYLIFESNDIETIRLDYLKYLQKKKEEEGQPTKIIQCKLYGILTPPTLQEMDDYCFYKAELTYSKFFLLVPNHIPDFGMFLNLEANWIEVEDDEEFDFINEKITIISEGERPVILYSSDQYIYINFSYHVLSKPELEIDLVKKVDKDKLNSQELLQGIW